MAYEHRTERPPRRGRVDDSGGDAEGGKKLYYHLTAAGRERRSATSNLIQLSSRAFLEGYYYKPRVDWELLERAPRGRHRHHRLPRRPRAAGAAATATTTARSRRRPGCRTSSAATTSSSSCRTTASPSSTAPTRSCSRSPASIGAPLLATNDSHYTHRDDARGPRRAAVRADRVAA